MIVKNESKVITRLLESVYPFLDSYCICDTGSTDNTVELIRAFFESKQIPGRIIFEPFRDFGYNRTYALKACEGEENADYILLLDADMVLENRGNIDTREFKRLLAMGDAHYIFQGSDRFFYKNTRVVKNNRGVSYWGVTHEYVNAPPNTVYTNIPRNIIFINDIGDGGAKSDKFLRDIRLLTKGLEENPNNDRYTFYLANSYRESGQIEKAIEFYEKRVEIGGWIEEVWYSLFCIARCYRDLSDPIKMVHYHLEAYNRFPQRIENLYDIIHHYRCIGKNQLAHAFYVMADQERKRFPAEDYLFMQKDIYDYKLDYELSIIGYYVNPDNVHDLAKVSVKVLNYPHGERGIRDNVMSNYKFYAKKLVNSSVIMSPQNLALLKEVGREMMGSSNGLVSSTPSIVDSGENELCVCVRYVDYKINDKGGYENGEHITSRNVIAIIDTTLPDEWSKVREFELRYDDSLDGLYVGLEDVRLLSTVARDRIYYNANRGLDRHKIAVEHGTIDLVSDITSKPANLLRMAAQERPSDIEKNWVLFESADNALKCVYKWSPLQIGDINGSEWVQTHDHPVPSVFDYVRGSTNGVVIGNEVWFINHLVSYEDRRYYYHIVVVLDRTTFKLKRYTAPWTFDGGPVEYTLGFTYNSTTRQFLIGYSVMDRETRYIQVPRFVFDGQFILHA